MSKTNVLFSFVLVASVTCTHATDTFTSNQIIRYGETIVSSLRTFELGFFSPDNTTNHYVGIWYKKISTGTVVWVANRNTPLTDASGELTLTIKGVLVLRNATGNVIWESANSLTTSGKNPIGQLLDTGNFVIYKKGDINHENPIWESFNFPTDTLLPGMKIGWNLDTGINGQLTSWKSKDDPAAGEFSARLDTKGYPQPFRMHGQRIIFRAGPWNGLRFSGDTDLRPNPIFNFSFVLNHRESYYQSNLLINGSMFTRLVFQPTGSIESLVWIDKKREWNLYLAPEINQCDQYNVCGPFGSCNFDNSPVCKCLKGFEPTSPEQWRVADWSQGCRRMIPLDCGPAEGFKKYSNMKLPDTQGSWYNQTMYLKECERMCKNNCSCTAYTNSNISGSGSGCLLWFGDLIDITTFTENDGDELYLRFPLESENAKKTSVGRRVRIDVPIAFAVLFILVVISLFYRFKWTRKKQAWKRGNELGRDPDNDNADEDLEQPLFGLSTLVEATNNFSWNSKLGEGGFGPVYKGVLEDGKEIAVKRLAKTSTQGLQEFKNEVISISKLQHRNLVTLLGCCIEGVEKMLIYEYMPNKGLDSFIFDKTQSKLLDWPARYHIIDGIARGLLYLHQDSRLRIIHRDLKASNILLDKDMKPKISDFGMAKSFGGNQIEANTNRVVGTYGYMSPEYAGEGIFSIKSDVYSFGVLMLEIVFGEKNRGFVHKEHCNNLIGHAWGLHKEGRSLQLVAKCLGESFNVSQVLRSIHVGLLCVQCCPEDRPTMTSLILMLGSDNPLPSPKEPEDIARASRSYGTSSTNELSITMLDGR